jgi:hypothetical protein
VTFLGHFKPRANTKFRLIAHLGALLDGASATFCQNGPTNLVQGTFVACPARCSASFLDEGVPTLFVDTTFRSIAEEVAKALVVDNETNAHTSLRLFAPTSTTSRTVNDVLVQEPEAHRHSVSTVDTIVAREGIVSLFVEVVETGNLVTSFGI